MFALRAIAATLSLFVLTYGLLSVLLAVSWSRVAAGFVGQPSTRRAQTLYLLRIMPLVGAAIVALLYELPSFLRFEPLVSGESFASPPFILSLLFLLVGAISTARMVQACRTTNALCRAWSKSKALEGRVVYETDAIGPPIAVAGVWQPRLLLSPRVAQLLGRQELELALAHETAHIRSKDNLRKLLLMACPFPGLDGLEREWADAAELAADQRAVASRGEALALASAIVKVAGLHIAAARPEALITNFVAGSASTAERVRLLTDWKQEGTSAGDSRTAVFAIALGLSLLTFSYSSVISHLHSFTEILFR